MAQRGLLNRNRDQLYIAQPTPAVDTSKEARVWEGLSNNLAGLANSYFKAKSDNKDAVAGSIEGAADEQQISTEGQSAAWINAAQSTFQAKIHAQTQGDIETLYQELGNSPDELEKSTTALIQGTLAGISQDAPEFAGTAKLNMEKIATAYVKKSRNDKVKRDLKAQLLLLGETADQAVEVSTKAIEVLPRADAAGAIKQQRDVVETALLAQIELGTIDEAQAEQVLQGFDENMATSFVKKGLNEAIDNGEGKKFLLDFIQSTDSGLSSDVKKKVVRELKTHLARVETLQNGIKREEKLASDAERANFVAELDVSVSRGEVTYRDLDNLKQDRVITDKEWAKHTKKLDSLKASQKAEVDFSEVVKNALVNGNWLPHEDKKLQSAMDKYYLKNLQASGKDPLSNEGMSYAVQLSKTGIVPKSVVSMIDNISRGGNVDRAALVSDLVLRLREDAPAAYSRLSENQKAFAMMTANAINAGADPETTIANAREYVYQTDPSVKEQLEVQVNSTEAHDETLNQLNNLIDDKWDGWFSSQPEAPYEMISDYNTLVTQFFLKTRDTEVAYEMANDAIQNRWGKTDIDGTNRLTRLPVESNYPEGAGEWLSQSLDLRKSELNASDQDILVITDPETERANARDKSYALFTIDKFGTPVPLLDDNNMPARWKPNPEETEAMKKNKILKQDSMKQAARGQELLKGKQAREADYNFNKKGADAKLRKIVKDVRGMK